MMKWRAIIGAVVLVAAFVALHVLYFSGRISKWKTLEANARQNVEQYKQIVGTTPLSLFNETALSGWLRQKEKEIAKTKESFNAIRQNYPLVILPESDVTSNYTMTLFNETIRRLDAIDAFEKAHPANPEAGVPFDRVKVLDDLDVKSSMVPGAVGMGYSSRLYRYPTYYLPMYCERDAAPYPRQGAVEFYFKPDDWATPDDRRTRTLFYAYGDDRTRPSVIPGAQNVYRPEIYIYKDGNSMLHFEITDFDGNTMSARPGYLDAQVGLVPQRFAYVSCVWNGNSLRMFVNGSEITNKGAPLTAPGGPLGIGSEAMGMGSLGARERIMMRLGGYGMGMGAEGLGMPGAQPNAAPPPSQIKGPEGLLFATLGLGGLQKDPFQNQADGTFDEFRIKKVGQPSPPPRAGVQVPGTLLLDSFESELPGKDEISNLIDVIAQNLRFIRTTSDPNAQRPYIEKMERLRACCGLGTDRLNMLNPSVRYVRRVHVFHEVSVQTGRSLSELFRTFCWLPPQEVRNSAYEIAQPTRDDMETFVGFLQLALELLQDAMRDDVRIDRVTGVYLEGEDLFPDFPQLEQKFKARLDELMNDKVLLPFHKGYQFVPPQQEWYDLLPELAMQDTAIMEAIMGRPQDASAMAQYYDPMMMMDPAEQERQMKETEKKINEWVQKKRDDVKRLETYLEAWRKKVIPPNVRDEVRLAKLAEGNVTYKKRSVRINFECNATALSRFLYAVEYGNNGRLANVESYDVATDNNARLTVSLVVDFHQVRDAVSTPPPGQPVAAVGAPGGAAPGTPASAPGVTTAPPARQP